MRRLLIFLVLLPSLAVSAQNMVAPAGYEFADSLVRIPTALEDVSLSGKSIFAVMPSKKSGDRAEVRIHQSQAIVNAMAAHINGNASRSITGYRVRIYFDNKQNSRGVSETLLGKFQSSHPDIPAYRSYSNPYFNVSVGDFRTKSEAMQFLQEIRAEYSSAVLVKEKINYPAVDRFNAYVVDTVKVLRPIKH